METDPGVPVSIEADISSETLKMFKKAKYLDIFMTTMTTTRVLVTTMITTTTTKIYKKCSG
jgi:hypothetical protein